tara:strand:+ start:1252 stop:2460 length:1209 start_codon:yes stop_codon:yes gene_type:complete
MSSTFTTNLRLNKQGDGDNPNSWGQVLNNGVISLVDDAVAGYTTISVGTTATVTLTENQGSGDQARSAFLEIKGSVGGSHSTINVLIPNNSKSYVVRNSVSYASAGADVILKVAGNTGVTIRPTENQFVITNGTSVFNVAPTEFSSLTVTGAATFESTVTVEGNGTFKGQVSTNSDMAVGGNFAVSGGSTFSGTVTIAGANVQAANAKVCASAFHGDGSNLTGIVAMPTGAIVPFGGSSAPTGFLLCSGQAVSRSTYSALFGVISTTYGAGDESSTFNLPDLRGRVVAGQDDMGGSSADRLTGLTGGVDGDTLAATGGAETHVLTTAQLATHTHGATKFYNSDPGLTNTRFSLVTEQTDREDSFPGYQTTTGDTNNIISTTGSGSAHNNVQPTIILNYIIKI